MAIQKITHKSPCKHYAIVPNCTHISTRLTQGNPNDSNAYARAPRQTARAARTVRVQGAEARRVLAPHSGLCRSRRSDLPRPFVAAAPIGKDCRGAARDDSRGLHV